MDENQNKLASLKAKAKKEGWDFAIKTKADEYALLQGYWFSWERANAVVDYIEKFLVLPKSDGATPVILMDWQKYDLIYPLFGWVRPDGTRRYRQGYVEIPKKNGKTATAGFLCLYMLDGDGEPGAEVYNCANDRGQAKIVWKMIQDIVVHAKKYLGHLKVTESTSTITKDPQSWIQAWSGDASSKDGPDIHFATADELHEWKAMGQKLWTIIEYGGAKRREPICPFAITTAGTADEDGICLRQHDYARQILDGVIYKDLSFFALIYCADHKKIEADPNYWKTEEAWKEANPSYGTLLSKSSFEDAVQKCENDPANKRTFLRYRLGVWSQGKSAWIPHELWAANAHPELINKEELKGMKCWVSFDLSSVEDTTALTACFPYQTETKEWKFKFISKIYCPKEMIMRRSQKSNVRYDLWAEAGEIVATPGPVVDHDYLFEDFKRFCEDFDVQMLSYDRRFSDRVIQLIHDHYPSLILDPFGQGTESMSSPTKAFFRELKRGTIEHEGTEVLAWQASNAVAEENAGGEIKLNKAMSKDKIDVIISMIMAFARANLYAENHSFQSYYESEEFLKELNSHEQREED